MSNLIDELTKEKENLTKLIKQTENALKNAPKGVLRVASCKKYSQYYWIKETGENQREQYIRKEQMQMAHNLAQRDYDMKVLKIANQKRNEIQLFLNSYQPKELQMLYENLNQHRKKIVIPRILSDSEYVSEWRKVEYKGKSFTEGMSEIYTNRGERVRSKTEKIIADMLDKKGIPYRYEYPIYLVGLGTIYPDFTTLNMRERKEKYWEHMGMMDDSNYIDMALHKIDVYAKNNIIVGDRLILTHETSKRPLETGMIEKMIQAYL